MMNDLITIAEGRLDMRDGKLYLNNEPLNNALATYTDGHIAICISKERAVARRKILNQIFQEGTGKEEE